MSSTSQPFRNGPGSLVRNPWLARAKKFLIVAGTAIVEIAAVWQGAPDWFYPLATAVGAVLTYLVPNAPKYRDQ